MRPKPGLGAWLEPTKSGFSFYRGCGAPVPRNFSRQICSKTTKNSCENRQNIFLLVELTCHMWHVPVNCVVHVVLHHINRGTRRSSAKNKSGLFPQFEFYPHIGLFCQKRGQVKITSPYRAARACPMAQLRIVTPPSFEQKWCPQLHLGQIPLRSPILPPIVQNLLSHFCLGLGERFHRRLHDCFLRA